MQRLSWAEPTAYLLKKTNILNFPTSLFTVLEPQNPWIDEFYVVQERLATNFKASKLGKGSSGYTIEKKLME